MVNVIGTDENLLVDKTDEVQGTLEHVCPPACTLPQIIAQASTLYNVSPTRLACLVRRESTNNPNAVSPSGRHFGYTQFDNSTWRETPYRDYSVFNGWANIHAAAYMISIGQANRFEAWRYC